MHFPNAVVSVAIACAATDVKVEITCDDNIRHIIVNFPKIHSCACLDEEDFKMFKSLLLILSFHLYNHHYCIIQNFLSCFLFVKSLEFIQLHKELKNGEQH
jgi:hypothetical protein